MEPVLEESSTELPTALRGSLHSASVWMRVLFGLTTLALLFSTLALYSQWQSMQYFRGFELDEESAGFADVYATLRNQFVVSCIFWLLGAALDLLLLLTALSYARAGRTGSVSEWETGLRREALLWWGVPALVLLFVVSIFAVNVLF